MNGSFKDLILNQTLIWTGRLSTRFYSFVPNVISRKMYSYLNDKGHLSSLRTEPHYSLGEGPSESVGKVRHGSESG